MNVCHHYHRHSYCDINLTLIMFMTVTMTHSMKVVMILPLTITLNMTLREWQTFLVFFKFQWNKFSHNVLSYNTTIGFTWSCCYKLNYYFHTWLFIFNGFVRCNVFFFLFLAWKEWREPILWRSKCKYFHPHFIVILVLKLSRVVLVSRKNSFDCQFNCYVDYQMYLMKFKVQNLIEIALNNGWLWICNIFLMLYCLYDSLD